MVIIQQIFIFAFTLLAYFVSLRLFRWSRLPLLNPLLTSSLIVIAMLYIMDYDYELFKEATIPIDFLLGPSVVALGWALYKQVEHLKAHYISILTSVVVGAIVGVVSVVGIMQLFDAPIQIQSSVVPKSVTTPIAIQIAEKSGGITSLTAVIVIITGIFGSLIAPPLLRKIGVTDAIARGLALGSAAHGVGTARALELGAIEGAISGLAIGLMGVVTTLVVPVIEWILSLL